MCVGDEKGEGVGGVGALEILLDLIGMQSELDTTAPLMQSIRMEDHYAVRSDTSGMVIGKLRRERALAVRPTLEEDMRRLTLGSARGVETAGSSRALEVVGCYGVHYSRRRRRRIRVEGTVTEKRSFEHSDSDMMRWWKISAWLNGARVATPTRGRQQVKNRESG